MRGPRRRKQTSSWTRIVGISIVMAIDVGAIATLFALARWLFESF